MTAWCPMTATPSSRGCPEATADFASGVTARAAPHASARRPNCTWTSGSSARGPAISRGGYGPAIAASMRWTRRADGCGVSPSVAIAITAGNGRGAASQTSAWMSRGSRRTAGPRSRTTAATASWRVCHFLFQMHAIVVTSDLSLSHKMEHFILTLLAME